MTLQTDTKIKASAYVLTEPGACILGKNEIAFCTAADPGSEVSLILYRPGTNEITNEFPMQEDPYHGSLRSIRISGSALQKTEYNYRINGKIVTDPFAQRLVGRPDFGRKNNGKGLIVRAALASADPMAEDIPPLRIPYEDVVAYTLHVRGFTAHRSSGVRHKGTFRGIAEKIPYLKELGVNQLILLPAYDFNEIIEQKTTRAIPEYAQRAEEARAARQNAAKESGSSGKNGTEEAPYKINYWGFTDEAYYLAPKAAYCATARPDEEFRSLVKLLHSNGIEVIMEFGFPSGISEAAVCRILSWWAGHYHVDGFMVLARPEITAMLPREEILADSKLIAGYFNTDEVLPGGSIKGRRLLADCNDGFKNDCRRLLKGDEGVLSAFSERMKQNHRCKAIMNYMTNHDGFTLLDLVSYDKKHNEANGEQNRDGASCDFSWNCGEEGPSRKKQVQRLRMRQMKNAMAMLLLAQGTPMILAGDEFGNTQMGNNNPYCQDNEITWIDWNSARRGSELLAFVKDLIALRRAYPVLRQAKPLLGSDTTFLGYPDISFHGSKAWYGAFDYQNRHLGIMYCARTPEQPFVYTAFNFHWESQTLAMPNLPKDNVWKLKAMTCDTQDDIIPEVKEREVVIPGRSVCVYVSEKQNNTSEGK